MLKDNWKDKQDGIDEILAEDINSIAKAIIDLQEGFENLETPDIYLSNYYTKTEIDQKIGDIEHSLDNIIQIQENLIGGDGE